MKLGNTFQKYYNIKPDLSFAVIMKQKEQLFVFGIILELYKHLFDNK